MACCGPAQYFDNCLFLQALPLLGQWECRGCWDRKKLLLLFLVHWYCNTLCYYSLFAAGWFEQSCSACFRVTISKSEVQKSHSNASQVLFRGVRLTGANMWCRKADMVDLKPIKIIEFLKATTTCIDKKKPVKLFLCLAICECTSNLKPFEVKKKKKSHIENNLEHVLWLDVDINSNSQANIRKHLKTAVRILMFAGVFFLFPWMTAQTLMRSKIIPQFDNRKVSSDGISNNQFLDLSDRIKKREFLANLCAPTFNSHTERGMQHRRWRNVNCALNRAELNGVIRRVL